MPQGELLHPSAAMTFVKRHEPSRVHLWAHSGRAWLVAITAGLMAGAVANGAPTGGVCSPPQLGAPCATGGMATLGSGRPGPSLALGNPVHLGTGNKYQLDIDLPPNPTAPGIEIVRHYNGLAISGTALGRNWALSYDTRLEHKGGAWGLRQADGSLLNIGEPAPSGDGHAWIAPGDRRLHFNRRGELVRITQGHLPLALIRRYEPPHHLAGLIESVHGARNHALYFHYGERHGQVALLAIDSPLGTFRYVHDTPDASSGHRDLRLTGVLRPDGMQRDYHHEAPLQGGNPYALTGISLRAPSASSVLSPGAQTTDAAAALRLATWHYDRHGRVIAARQHGQGLPAWRIDYVQTARQNRPGLTRIHDDAGHSMDIAHALNGGRHVPLANASYDARGRLASLGTLALKRNPDGGLTGLQVGNRGWPGLSFERLFSSGGLAWHSTNTGHTVMRADAQGRPAHVRHANGDTLTLLYDAQGRLQRLEAAGGTPRHSVATRTTWNGTRLLRVEHPAETELRTYDAMGRLTRRVVRRPSADDAEIVFRDAFEYDRRGRLLRHQLPEGGALHYGWADESSNTRLAELIWEDANGVRNTVITSDTGQPGYRHGNGLRSVSMRRVGAHDDRLLLLQGESPWWRQHRHHDAQGRVTGDDHAFPALGHHDSLSFTYDAHSRLQGARHHSTHKTARWWYAWHDDGRLAAAKRNETHIAPARHHDASGLPQRVGELTLHFGPERRLSRITRAGSQHELARYAHNAFGHRILKQVGGRAIHFLYLNNRLVAEAGPQSNGPAFTVTRRYLYAGAAVVGMIVYSPHGEHELYAVHTDLAGAPRLITDARRHVRWLATYSPTGQATRIAGNLDFALRLPGQYEDAETGWHDNLLRTYVPDWGQYLEPDPLGPMPDSDTYGYAAQQPWRHVDPYGLLLFAFDGTRYSGDTAGNVHTLAQAYRDGAAHYHSGPGNSYFLDWDAVTAWQAGRILENQWQSLLTSLEHAPQDTPVPIDLLGFSRGAALARHFGNRIASHVDNGVFSVDDPLRGRVTACVDLRFMGLFDSVAQFGIGGSHNHLYDFGVAEMWSWVAHAVASHERRWAFPLLSADAGGAGNVIEAPFVGIHSDIGGGTALYGEAPTEPGSDLAKVALAWMHWQALAANVDFAQLNEAHTQVMSPVLRDLRSPLLRTVQEGDRAIQAPSGAVRRAYQHDDPRLGATPRTQMEAFIHRADNWRSNADDHVGSVDMQGYEQWLNDTLGWAR